MIGTTLLGCAVLATLALVRGLRPLLAGSLDASARRWICERDGTDGPGVHLPRGLSPGTTRPLDAGEAPAPSVPAAFGTRAAA